MATTTRDDGTVVEIVERYVVMAAMDPGMGAPYGLKVVVRGDDTEEWAALKASGYRFVGGAWVLPGRKAECATEMARLVNERSYSIPGGKTIAASVPSMTREIRQMAGLTAKPVYPNPMFS